MAYHMGKPLAEERDNESQDISHPKVLNPDEEESVSFPPPAWLSSVYRYVVVFPAGYNFTERICRCSQLTLLRLGIQNFSRDIRIWKRAGEQRRRRTDVVHGAGQASTWCFVLHKRGCGERALRPPI